jgi:hypothetical protein
MLLKVLSTRRSWILYAKPPFFVQCANCAPPLVAAFVEATNSCDLERIMVRFVDDALVNDQLLDHYENFIVIADIDGNFDKRGLPVHSCPGLLLHAAQ